MRVIVQPLPINPSLPIGPTPTMFTTMVTSTQMSAVEPTATTAYPTPIPVTVYSLARCKIQEIPNPPMRRFQGKEDPSTPVVAIPLRHSCTKLQVLPQPCRPERTLHGQIPCQPLLTYLSQGHHGQFPQVKSQHICSLKQKRQKTGHHQR